MWVVCLLFKLKASQKVGGHLKVIFMPYMVKMGCFLWFFAQSQQKIRCPAGISSSAYNYDTCCIKSKGSCGAFTKPRQPVAGLYSVKDLKLSVKDHIKSSNLHTSNIPLTFFSERTLIENRIGNLLNSDGVICAEHQ